jgi:hypothetical protein
VIITTRTSATAMPIPRGVSKATTGRLSGFHRPPALATCQQWDKVAETLAADENDCLVVTGYPVLDKETEAIVVLGQYVTTSSQQGKRPSGKK